MNLHFSMAGRFSRISKAFALTAFVSAISAGSAFADAQQDYYFQLAQQRYFRLPQTARTFAMEGSVIATSSDSQSIIGNPAGLGFMKNGELALNYGFGALAEGKDWPAYNDAGQSDSEGSVLLALPIMPHPDYFPRYGNLGLGWTGYSTNTTDGNDTETDGTILNLAYGIAVDNSTSLGYSFNWFQDSLDTRTTSYDMNDGYRHTFGIQNRPDDNLAIGGLFYFGYGDPNVDVEAGRFVNFNTGDKVDLETKAHGFDIGMAYHEADTLFALSADYNWYKTDGGFSRFGFGPDGDERGEDYSFRAGVEHEIDDMFLLRAGYRYQGNQHYRFNAVDELEGSAKYNALSAGLGLRLSKYFVLDYGAEVRFLGHGEEWQQMLTATMPFSLCIEDWT